MTTPLRDLTVAFLWRELAIRYKRSVLGVAWALAEPLVVVATYVAFFGLVLRAGHGVDDYPLYVLFGTLPWIFFSTTVEQSSTTMIEHAPLARKIPFPWEILFVAIGFSRLTTLLIGLLLGVIAMAAFGSAPHWPSLVWMPIGVVLLCATAFGASLFVGALQPLLRDVSFLARYALRLLFYTVPIAYPAKLVPAAVGDAFYANPLVGLLWFFQAPVSAGAGAPPTVALAWSALFALLVFAGGWWFFRRMRNLVADVL
jgi:lipopolysaccharide transport system permease protein